MELEELHIIATFAAALTLIGRYVREDVVALKIINEIQHRVCAALRDGTSPTGTSFDLKSLSEVIMDFSESYEGYFEMNKYVKRFLIESGFDESFLFQRATVK